MEKNRLAYYAMFDKKKREILRVIKDKKVLRDVDTDLGNLGIDLQELNELLKDMVRNNILYFDPIEAIYYPQVKSSQWGIRLYFESLTK